MDYIHTQPGYLMLFMIVFMLGYSGFILNQVDFDILVVIMLGFITLLFASFLSLTTMVDEKHLQIKFGYGIFRKRFMIKEITSVRTVKNHWYYGWGVRFLPFSRMWIYNVSGFDAVEIKMKDGRIYRIGTNEPKKLEYALLKAIKS